MAELSIGDEAPAFELPDTEGTSHSLADGGQPTAVVFTCNHCPYALAWHDRILDVAREYEPRGARVLLISPNDAERYPRDSYEAMQQRVRDDGGWPAPYLYDETPGRRARVRREDDARTCSWSTPRAGCATAARRTPTTTTRSRTPSGYAARSMRCSKAADPDAGRNGARRLQRQVEVVGSWRQLFERCEPADSST